MTAWLEELRAGDAVIVTGRGSRDVCTVTKASLTTVTVGEVAYNRSDGKERGGGQNAARLEEATSGAVQLLRDAKLRHELIDELDCTDWHGKPLSVLKAVAALLSDTKE